MAHGSGAARFWWLAPQGGRVRKRAGEVVGAEQNFFEVMGRRGTHCGGCSTVLAVGRRGAPVRSQGGGHWH
jgi:hypothetical protein